MFALVILLLYVLKRDCTIPLTSTRMFDNWGGVRTLFASSQAPVTLSALEAQLWCPAGVHSSPQCGCLLGYYNNTYVPDVLMHGLQINGVSSGSAGSVQPPYPGANASLLSELGQKHSDGIITSCLRRRSSWRKDSCGDFCRIHLSTPVLLASYYMTMLFSRVTRYNDPVLRAFACYLPVPLGFCIIGLQLALDRTGGIVGSLSILSVMLESYYLGPNPPWESEVFWSYHRFLLAALAVWAAVTHQARDVYLVGSYTLLAFFAGFMAYTVSLIKQGNPKAHSGTICLHLYIGISAIVACFVLLLQQHWYLSSPMWSSVVSPVALMVGFCQCLSQAPFGRIPLPVNMTVTLGLLTACFAAVVTDLVGGSVV